MRLAPAGFVGRELQHAVGARILRQQLQAKGKRILMRRVREFVDERFNDEAVPVRVRRAPRTGRNAALVVDVAHAHMRDRVGRVDHAEHGEQIDAAVRIGAEAAAHGRRCVDHPVLEPRRLNDGGGQRAHGAVRHDAAHRVHAHRTVEVVLDVVFARPRDLHRFLDRLGDFDRFLHVVGLEPPAEAAAEIRRVHGNLVER